MLQPNMVSRGALRYAIDNRKAAEALEKEFMEVSWVGIEIAEQKIIIDVVEKILPEEMKEAARAILLPKRTVLLRRF